MGRDGEHLDLTVDGIPYSSYHRDRPWTGYIWDALAATVALVEEPAPKVLLLGCAAGTVLALIRRLRPRARLTAVELSPDVLALARKQFGLDELGVEVILGDGVDFVRRTRRRFHVVIDDMFAPGRAGILRPVEDESVHLAHVHRLVISGGLSATNVTTDGDPPGLAAAGRRAYREAWPFRATLKPPRGFNLVLAGSDEPLDPARLARTAAELPPHDAAALRALSVRPTPP